MIGSDALDLIQYLVDRHRLAGVDLIRHRVGINWRQTHPDVVSQAASCVTGLFHDFPLERRRLSLPEIQRLRLQDLEADACEAWSVLSITEDEDGRPVHLPLMNLHPQAGVEASAVAQCLAIITDRRPGFVLDSGRYTHYYGDFILPAASWPAWMGEFLGPCVLVSPRYVGHRLHHGYAALRLTADPTHKPTVPRVVERIVGENSHPYWTPPDTLEVGAAVLL